MKRKAKKQRYVVVATASRPWAVVAGEYVGEKDGKIELRNARMIVYYSPASHSLYGLAQSGPAAGSRVSPPVEAARVRGIEHELDCSAMARAAIEAEPWS